MRHTPTSMHVLVMMCRCPNGISLTLYSLTAIGQPVCVSVHCFTAGTPLACDITMAASLQHRVGFDAY